jgi:hypothetical protein
VETTIEYLLKKRDEYAAAEKEYLSLANVNHGALMATLAVIEKMQQEKQETENDGRV